MYIHTQRRKRGTKDVSMSQNAHTVWLQIEPTMCFLEQKLQIEPTKYIRMYMYAHTYTYVAVVLTWSVDSIEL